MCEREILSLSGDSVSLERRELLRLSMFSLVYLSLGGSLQDAMASPDAPPSQDLRWQDLLDIWSVDADRAVGDDDGETPEETYLRRGADMLRHLVEDPGLIPGERPTAQLGGADFELLHQERPMLALRFRLQPGASFPLHDHQHQNGVMKVLQGHLELHSFDAVEPETSSTATGFAVREVSKQQLTEGQVAVLSRRRNNIHGLTAGAQGATVLDVFTHYRADAHSRRLEIDPEPIDAAASIYWARVRGMF